MSSDPKQPALKLVDRSVLLASLSNLETPTFLTLAITSAATFTRNRLVVVVFSSLFDQALSHSFYWNDVQRLLTFIYVQATAVAQKHDRILMEIDVLIKRPKDDLSTELSGGFDVVYRVFGDPQPPPPTLSSCEQIYLPPSDSVDIEKAQGPDATLGSALSTTYPVAALGGTFDHLHPGHKILLSMGAWLATEKLIVGVTDDQFLRNKANKHLLQPLTTRIDNVREFLLRFRSDLVYDVVAIHDVYGPTGWDPYIHALVVSKETLNGAASIAAHREKEGLSTLKTFVIDVISSTSSNLDHEDAELMKKTKMSSTFIREWIAKNQADSDVK